MPTKLIPSFLSLRLKSRLIATIVGSEAPWNLPSIATPRIPHDEVMAGARHIIEQAKAKRKSA